MSFGGLVLTNLGRNELAKAELGTPYNISSIVLGDGRYDGSYVAIQNIVSPVMNLPVKKIVRNDGEVTIETEFNTNEIPKAFFLREIGIIANEKLCYYDNSRDDAEFLDPSSEVVIKQKRMRFVLLISAAAKVTATITSGLYALESDLLGLEEEFQKHCDEVNPHEITKEKLGLGEVNNTSNENKPVSTQQQEAIQGAYEQATGYTDQKIADLIGGAPKTLDTLKEIADEIAKDKGVVEALDAAMGKKANQTELDTHTGNDTIHVTQTEKNNWNNKQEKNGDSADNTVTFTSGDTVSATGWKDVAVLASKETHKSLFNKISTAISNLRYLYKMLGTTDISKIGGGTVTGAISELNTGLNNINNIEIRSGNIITAIAQPATPTVIGSITLSEGLWIIIVDVWSPVLDSPCTLAIAGYEAMYTFRHGQVLACANNTHDKLYELRYTQWTSAPVTVETGSIRAIMIK